MQSKHPKTLFAMFLVLFSITYFGFRLPVIHEPLYFEEGIFASLFVNCPPGPEYGLCGRIDGREVYGMLSHPAGSYEMLRLGGWMGQSVLGDPARFDDTVITPRLRLICSLYSYFVWVAFAWVVFCSGGGRWKYILLAAGALSPLAIKTSVLLQIDNTAGVVFCGCACLLIYLGSRPALPHVWQKVLVGIGGCVAALGKQEWSLSLIAAAAVVMLLETWRSRLKSPGGFQLAIYVIIGAVLGNVLSCLYDPKNYLQAFSVMKNFTCFSEVAQQNQLLSLFDLIKLRLPFLFVCFMMLGLSLYFVLIGNSRSFLHTLFLWYGGFLLAAYFVLSNTSEMRYFAPSLAVLTFVCVLAIPDIVTTKQSWIIQILTSALIVTSVVFVLYFVPNRNSQLEQIQQKSLKPVPGKLIFMDSCAAWNKPDFDFLTNTMGYSNAHERAKREGRELVMPPVNGQDDIQAK